MARLTRMGSMPFDESAARALVLGSGGIAGAAWLAGVLAGLSEGGANVADADRIIGTSAGALVGARLALGTSPAEIASGIAGTPPIPGGRLRVTTSVRLLLAQVAPSRRHALVWLGRAAVRSRSMTEEAWVSAVGAGLADRDWPERLWVVAVDARSGRPAYFDSASRVPLDRAVAASCAVPGVFPPVAIHGRPTIDGGLRSPANADLARGFGRVLVIAPLYRSARAPRRPSAQVAALAPQSRTALIVPQMSLGLDALDPRRSAQAAGAGRAQGLSLAAEVGRMWRPEDTGPTDVVS